MRNYIERVAVSIALNEALSGAVQLKGRVPVAVVMPADWTAADLTFQASYDGATYWNLYDGDTDAEVSVQAAEDRHIVLDHNKFYGAQYLKVRSGTAASAVNQEAARTLYLVTREI
jgi:hypothetical protein